MTQTPPLLMKMVSSTLVKNRMYTPPQKWQHMHGQPAARSDTVWMYIHRQWQYIPGYIYTARLCFWHHLRLFFFYWKYCNYIVTMTSTSPVDSTHHSLLWEAAERRKNRINTVYTYKPPPKKGMLQLALSVLHFSVVVIRGFINDKNKRIQIIYFYFPFITPVYPWGIFYMISEMSLIIEPDEMQGLIWFRTIYVKAVIIRGKYYVSGIYNRQYLALFLSIGHWCMPKNMEPHMFFY